MTDVPKDIMETARDIYERLFRLGAHSKGLVVRDPLELIASALLSERERRTAQGVTVPAGWKLVPIEPTEAMITAGRLARMNIEGGYGGPGPWEAMLAAAPSLSTSAGGGERG